MSNTNLIHIASEASISSGLQKCNQLELLIVEAYKKYQEEMLSMGNSIYADNRDVIIASIKTEETTAERRS